MATGVGDQAFEPNPWGCYAQVDNPHRATSTGHQNHIHAYGHIKGCTGVPSTAKRRIELWLYRIEPGNPLIKYNLYKCPEGYGQPDCYLGGSMRAVIDYHCNVSGDYYYMVRGHMWIDYGGRRYEATVQKTSPSTCHRD